MAQQVCAHNILVGSRPPNATSQILIFAGYIGGSVLNRLIQHPEASATEITALVRSEEKATKLEQFGVKTVLGSLDDASKLEDLVSQTDVVFQTVSLPHAAWHVDSRYTTLLLGTCRSPFWDGGDIERFQEEV